MFITIQFCMFLSQVLSFQIFPKIFLRFSTLNVGHNWWRVCLPVVRFFTAGVAISVGTKIFPRHFCSTKQKHSQNSDFSKRSVRTPFSVRILKAQLKILVREGPRCGWIKMRFEVIPAVSTKVTQPSEKWLHICLNTWNYIPQDYKICRVEF